MQINVSQLLQAPIGTLRDYDVDETLDIFGDGKAYNVRGSVRLMRTHRSILVTATLTTEVELTCSRCLCAFHCPLTLNIEEEYVPTIDIYNGTPLPPPEEPGTFTIDEHHVIDLAEAIRQYVVLATPMKPLCTEECAGLCQKCGRNLNEGACNCAEEEIDPRWAELIKLLK